MEIKRFETNRRMSRTLEWGELIYFCGETCAGEDITAQAKGVLEKLEQKLTAHGSDKAHILNALVFLSDIALKDGFDRVWDDWTAEGCPPARACVEARLASDQLLVEVVMTAVKAGPGAG